MATLQREDASRRTWPRPLGFESSTCARRFPRPKGRPHPTVLATPALPAMVLGRDPQVAYRSSSLRCLVWSGRMRHPRYLLNLAGYQPPSMPNQTARGGSGRLRRTAQQSSPWSVLSSGNPGRTSYSCDFGCTKSAPKCATGRVETSRFRQPSRRGLSYLEN